MCGSNAALFIAALCNRAGHICLHPVVSSSLFSSPNLSGRRLDVYHTTTHGVALVQLRTQVWNVLCAACWKYRTQKIAKKSPSGHHPTTLSGYIFATKACIDNRKKILKQQYLLHMSPPYGELRPTSGWDLSLVLGTPVNSNGFHVLAALLHGTLVVGISQTLRRWTEGTTYIRQGGHHVGHF